MPTEFPSPEGAAAILLGETCRRPFGAHEDRAVRFLGLTPQATCLRPSRGWLSKHPLRPQFPRQDHEGALPRRRLTAPSSTHIELGHHLKGYMRREYKERK
jgi:hypothetical protein